MLCPICGQNIKDDARFCGKCGQEIPRCPTCGKVIYRRIRFCTKDGTPLPQDILDLLPKQQSVPTGQSPAVNAAPSGNGHTDSRTPDVNGMPVGNKKINPLLILVIGVGVVISILSTYIFVHLVWGSKFPFFSSRKNNIVYETFADLGSEDDEGNEGDMVFDDEEIPIDEGSMKESTDTDNMDEEDFRESSEPILSLDNKKLRFTSEGQTKKLIVKSENIDPDDITYTSVDEKIAEVDQNGMITAIADGRTTVIVSVDGISRKCEVVCNISKEEEVDRTHPIRMPASVSVSSVLSDSTGNDYGAGNLMDGSTSTAWSEGVSGTGVGEYADFSFDRADGADIYGIAIMPGYLKSGYAYRNNGVPLTIAVEAGKHHEEFTLFSSVPSYSKAKRKVHYLELDEPVRAKTLRVSIKSATAGSKYQDTCISEMYPFTYR